MKTYHERLQRAVNARLETECRVHENLKTSLGLSERPAGRQSPPTPTGLLTGVLVKVGYAKYVRPRSGEKFGVVAALVKPPAAVAASTGREKGVPAQRIIFRPVSTCVLRWHHASLCHSPLLSANFGFEKWNAPRHKPPILVASSGHEWGIDCA